MLLPHMRDPIDHQGPVNLRYETTEVSAEGRDRVNNPRIPEGWGDGRERKEEDGRKKRSKGSTRGDLGNVECGE